jgi:hypothetical protein
VSFHTTDGHQHQKVKRKASAVQDVRKIVEDQLARMLAQNPLRMDYYRRYSEIVADYNREKDRVTIEETFARLVDLGQRPERRTAPRRRRRLERRRAGAVRLGHAQRPQ